MPERTGETLADSTHFLGCGCANQSERCMFAPPPSSQAEAFRVSWWTVAMLVFFYGCVVIALVTGFSAR